jgi:hypothetical protein
MALRMYARNLNFEILIVQDGDMSLLNPIPRQPQYPKYPLKGPDTERHIDPGFVAPLMSVPVPNMPVARKKSKEGQDDVPSQE